MPPAARLGGRWLSRRGGAGPDGVCLHVLGGGARQRLHRRLRRRPRVRHHRRPARPGLVPFVEETGALASLLVWPAGRRGRAGTRDKDPDLADGAVRDSQPHDSPDGAGRGRARWRRLAGRRSPWWPGSVPGGAASVVFALLALEELEAPPQIAPSPSSPSPCCSASSHTARRPNRWLPGTPNCWPIAPPGTLAP